MHFHLFNPSAYPISVGYILIYRIMKLRIFISMFCCVQQSLRQLRKCNSICPFVHPSAYPISVGVYLNIQNYVTVQTSPSSCDSSCYSIAVEQRKIILWGGGIMAHGLNTWQTLIYLYTIFSIGPQWENRYEVTLNLTQPHLPWVFMTYHDHSHLIKTNTYEPPYLAQI